MIWSLAAVSANHLLQLKCLNPFHLFTLLYWFSIYTRFQSTETHMLYKITRCFKSWQGKHMECFLMWYIKLIFLMFFLIKVPVKCCLGTSNNLYGFGWVGGFRETRGGSARIIGCSLTSLSQASDTLSRQLKCEILRKTSFNFLFQKMRLVDLAFSSLNGGLMWH